MSSTEGETKEDKNHAQAQVYLKKTTEKLGHAGMPDFEGQKKKAMKRRK